MTIFEFPERNLGDYKSLHFTTSSYTDIYRVCFMNGSTAVATIVFNSAGGKTVYIDAENNKVWEDPSDKKDCNLSQITHISFGGYSGSGSIVLTQKPYLEKPMSLTWDDSGTAEIDITDLTASGNFTFDDQTGELTKTEGSGELSVNFPAGGVDLSSLTGFSVTYSGTNLFGGFKIGISESKKKDFYSNPTGRDDLATHITTVNVGDPSAITLWKWWNNAETGTMTISSIKLKANVVNAHLGEEVPMSSLTNYLWDSGTSVFKSTGYTPSYRVRESTGAAYFGVDYSGENCQRYSDVDGYKAIRIYSPQGNVPRAMFFNNEGNNQTAFNFTWNDAGGYYELLLSTVYASVGNYKLISVRPQQYTTSTIDAIYMIVDDPVYDYVIIGKGIIRPSISEILADANATSIDATGITAATALPTANPNCLIVANDGMVTNTQNVIVGGTCANLVLTDNHPFKAPADFTATTATYNTTINTTAKAGTLYLPYAAAIPSGVKAYTLTYTSGSEVTATEITTGTIPANTPVLLNGEGSTDFNGTGVAIDADGAFASGALTGVLEQGFVPKDSYVLQNGDSGLGFYKVAADNTIGIKPFRAYLTATGGGSRVAINFADETTGINAVQGSDVKVNGSEAVYNLQGQRVAQPTKGLYIVNGKKVIVK